MFAELLFVRKRETDCGCGLMFRPCQQNFRAKLLFFQASELPSRVAQTRTRARVLVESIHRRLWFGRDDHLDQTEAYNIS